MTPKHVLNKTSLNIPEISTNVCLIGTFQDIGWEDIINQYLDTHGGKYWLPWGDRTKSLNLLVEALVLKNVWSFENRLNCSVYTNNNLQSTLKLFHYRSRAQGQHSSRTLSCIKTRYCIDGIVISSKPISPNATLPYPLLINNSKCWIRLSNKQLQRHHKNSQPLDFSDFDIYDPVKHQFSLTDVANTTHMYKLYSDVIIAKHFSHKPDSNCKCIQCNLSH